MARASTRNSRRLLVSVLACTAVVVARPPSSAIAAPPDDTFEIGITGDTTVAPGGTLTFAGTCWSSAVGVAQIATVRGFRYVPLGSGVTPFMFAIRRAPDHATGVVRGSIRVPGDAPNGAYRLEISCFTEDQGLGRDEVPFTVDGPQITTTTSSTPLRAERHGVEPPPASPQRGTADFTG
jgi:hypothetical protein